MKAAGVIVCPKYSDKLPVFLYFNTSSWGALLASKTSHQPVKAIRSMPLFYGYCHFLASSFLVIITGRAL